MPRSIASVLTLALSPLLLLPQRAFAGKVIIWIHEVRGDVGLAQFAAWEPMAFILGIIEMLFSW